MSYENKSFGEANLLDPHWGIVVTSFSCAFMDGAGRELDQYF